MIGKLNPRPFHSYSGIGTKLLQEAFWVLSLAPRGRNILQGLCALVPASNIGSLTTGALLEPLYPAQERARNAWGAVLPHRVYSSWLKVQSRKMKGQRPCFGQNQLSGVTDVQELPAQLQLVSHRQAHPLLAPTLPCFAHSLSMVSRQFLLTDLHEMIPQSGATHLGQLIQESCHV